MLSLPKSEIIQIIERTLGLENPYHSSELYLHQIIAEYLRDSIYTLTISSSESQPEPVFTTRLLNHVRRHLIPLWPDKLANESSFLFSSSEETEEADPLRFTLNLLDDIRDVASLGNGYWLPTPVRFIKPQEEQPKQILVIGALSTRKLQNILNPRIELKGLVRVIKSDLIPDEIYQDHTQWQSFGNWLGNPPEDLCKWTSQYIERCQQSHHPSGSEVRNFDIYLPQHQHGNLQYYRWHPSTEIHSLPDGFYLCRSRASSRYFGPRGYWLGTVKEENGQLQMEAESLIPAQDVRRLQYGFDLMYDRPTTVALEYFRGKTIFSFQNLLPQEESRFFLALTTNVSTTFMKYPIRFMVEPDFVKQGISLLEGLAIQTKANPK